MYPNLDLLDHTRPILGPKQFELWFLEQGKHWYAGICSAYRVYDVIVIELGINPDLFPLLDLVHTVFLHQVGKSSLKFFSTEKIEYVFRNWKYRIERDISEPDQYILYIRSDQ